MAELSHPKLDRAVLRAREQHVLVTWMPRDPIYLRTALTDTHTAVAAAPCAGALVTRTLVSSEL